MLKCQKDGLVLSLRENKGVYEIEHQGFSWVSEGRKPYVLVRRNIAGKQIPLYLPFCAAKVKTHKVENDAIVSRYTGFSLAGTRFPFTLVCTAQITDGNTVSRIPGMIVFMFILSSCLSKEGGCLQNGCPQFRNYMP